MIVPQATGGHQKNTFFLFFYFFPKRRSGAGPFDVVLAVGPLTSAGGEVDLAPILAGETPPAVPIYFFEPGESASLQAKLEEHPCEKFHHSAPLQ